MKLWRVFGFFGGHESGAAVQEIELPEKVDVIVHEILGEIASREGASSAGNCSL